MHTIKSVCKIKPIKIYLIHEGFVTYNFLLFREVKLCSSENDIQKDQLWGYPEMSNTACSSHRHGDVKLRSDYSFVSSHILTFK